MSKKAPFREQTRVRWNHLSSTIWPELTYNFYRRAESHMIVSFFVMKHATESSNWKRCIISGYGEVPLESILNQSMTVKSISSSVIPVDRTGSWTP
jgi:hypothetical protein